MIQHSLDVFSMSGNSFRFVRINVRKSNTNYSKSEIHYLESTLKMVWIDNTSRSFPHFHCDHFTQRYTAPNEKS